MWLSEPLLSNSHPLCKFALKFYLYLIIPLYQIQAPPVHNEIYNKISHIVMK